MNRKYKPIKLLNLLFSFKKDYLISMMNNLSYLNSIKIYNDTNSLYLSILGELKQIKELFDSYNNIILSKNSSIINIIESNIINISNHITPDNFTHIFKLFLDENWFDYYDSHDLDKLLFITRFIKPISIWDSSYHSHEISYLSIDKTNENKFDEYSYSGG